MAYQGGVCILIGVAIGAMLYFMFGTNVQQRGQFESNNYQSRYNERSSYSGAGSSNPTTYDCDECTICFCSLSNETKVVLKTCKHAFHKKCIEQLMRSGLESKCPNCRRPFNLMC